MTRIPPVEREPIMTPDLRAVDPVNTERPTIGAHRAVRQDPFTRDTMVTTGGEQPSTQKTHDDVRKQPPGMWDNLQDGFMDFVSWLLDSPAEPEEESTELGNDGKTGAGQGAAHPSPAKRHDPTRWVEKLRWQNEARSNCNEEEFWRNLNADKIMLLAFKGVEGIERDVIQDMHQEMKVYFSRQNKIRQEYFTLTDQERRNVKARLKAESLKHGSKVVTSTLLATAAAMSGSTALMAVALPLALIKLGQSTFHFLPKSAQKKLVGDSKPGQEGYLKGMLRAGMSMAGMAADAVTMLAPTLMPGAGAAALLAKAVSGTEALVTASKTGADIVYKRQEQLNGATRKDIDNRSRKNTGHMKRSADRMSRASESIGRAAEAAVKAEENRTRAIQEWMRTR